ncbi:MAG: methyltransferase domain-containing protein [Methanosarcinales archaeon]|nr:methyltransferase domain-containing protein [Methanosarcinales archaeon]
MSESTEQMREWGGEFGKNYTDRNALSLDEMEALYKKNYGFTRTELNEKFLNHLDRSACILEVGSNIGNQLMCLQKMGFDNLYGIELQNYAVELSKSRTKNINIIQGEASDIPFKDNYFDMVFTSGVLIHIHPHDLDEVMKEIYRCTPGYIFGLEYYSENPTEIEYRGHQNLLWKADFARKYLELFDDLDLVEEEKIKYLDNENMDSMFLLRKRMM